MLTPRERYTIRKERCKKRYTGTTVRPRLCVFRSVKHLYAQLIDDTTGKTIATVGTTKKGADKKVVYGGNIAGAKKIGKEIAEKALVLGITEIVFDRGGRIYHGRIKALADAAREAGLKF